ncbi:Crp/Fnr family transcriptional regulator [Pseudonocardia sediminis]|uniref:Crp/Fnr family transcriptional regulator n=1 Tax=Pseudonocardia sediminis TaxID=1397368 RepID=A0A4Q7UXE2_PSEST|nr:Crp/Fnr family transcriptional regulator [Pseudonocardia sediminis]RZT84799.1 Crp/Fnr family transcriptional regulator [Pseudonocardia sediminis]
MPTASIEDERAVSPFLLGGPNALTSRIAELGSPRHYRAGDHVYRQGETSAWFHVVVSGRVRIYLHRPDGTERVLAYAEPGSSLGEAACFDGRPRHLGSIATQPSEVVTVSRDALLDAARADPELLLEITRRIAYKQRVLQLHVMIDGLPARERVTLLLGHLVEAYGEVSLDTSTRLSIRPAIDELALMVGLTRVTMSRELSKLVAEGVLLKDGRAIVVRDLPGLRRRVHAVAV